MIKVNVIIENQSWKNYIKNPERSLNSYLKKINKNTPSIKNGDFSFSLMLSGNKKIRLLNSKYRRKNKITDILSFPFYSKRDLNSEIRKKKNIYLGDIIINFYSLNQRGKKFKNSFNKLWIHGLLHLLGHRHKRIDDYLKMKRLEDKFLKLIS